jgi:3-phosphoshikimate 1-carboxyvinyltransferase
VVPATRLRGEIRVPGDKSIAHRALLANAVAEDRATVLVRAPGADVRSTARALRRSGADITVFTAGREHADEPAGTGRGSREAGLATDPEGDAVRFDVVGTGTDGELGRLSGGDSIDCGNSGTTIRFLSGLLAASPGQTTTLTGDESLRRRPMERVAAPLRAMGADVRTEAGHPPLTVAGQRPLRAVTHELPVASAQVLGAITFAALAADGTTTIDTPGPTRDHTERLLAWMGAPVARDGSVTTVGGPSALRARSIGVPGDISSAAAWLVAATIHPDAELRLLDVGLNPSRTALIDVLREMGGRIDVEPQAADGPEPVGHITVRTADRLEAVAIHGRRVAQLIDELPLLAIAMAAADGTSEVRDAAELRVKESDRIDLMVRNLAAIGARVEERPDGWCASRGRPREAVIETQGDHRIAMAFAVAALTGLSPRITIDDPACVDVSYPTFWSHVTATGLRP